MWHYMVASQDLRPEAALAQIPDYQPQLVLVDVSFPTIEVLNLFWHVWQLF
jgi:hypothetical protein